jgi:hypothetical protein
LDALLIGWTPVTTMRADDLVTSGKVRYIGFLRHASLKVSQAQTIVCAAGRRWSRCRSSTRCSSGPWKAS